MTTPTTQDIRRAAAALRLAGWPLTAEAVERRAWPRARELAALVEEAARMNGAPEVAAWVALKALLERCN